MTKCTRESFNFPDGKNRTVEVNFEGVEITSDGGVMLLRQVDKRIEMSKAIAQALEDIRQQASCKHDNLTLLRQRVYALACGYEDLNDHQQLRHDLAIQSAVEREEVLANSSTLCRWQNQANRQTAWHIHQVMIKGLWLPSNKRLKN